MNKLCLVLLLTVGSFAFTLTTRETLQDVNWPFAVCGNGTWDMKNLSLSAAPSRNSVTSLTAVGTANDYSEFSQVDLTVKLNGQFLHNETSPFESTYDSGDVIEYKFKTLIPSFSPSGNYVLTFNYKEPSGKINGCWSLTFKL